MPIRQAKTWRRWRPRLLVALVAIGIGCVRAGRLVIPSCPQPTANQAALLQDAANADAEFAGLEKRRILHCCRLEVLKDSDRAELCVELIEELSQ